MICEVNTVFVHSTMDVQNFCDNRQNLPLHRTTGRREEHLHSNLLSPGGLVSTPGPLHLLLPPPPLLLPPLPLLALQSQPLLFLPPLLLLLPSSNVLLPLPLLRKHNHIHTHAHCNYTCIKNTCVLLHSRATKRLFASAQAIFPSYQSPLISCARFCTYEWLNT